MKEPQTVFHGGCLGCTTQRTKGIGSCTGCKYFQCDWSLPDLNRRHADQDKALNKIRFKAKVRNLGTAILLLFK